MGRMYHLALDQEVIEGARFAFLPGDPERVPRIAKAFDPEHNLDMSYAGCGGMLLAEDCDWCGNYEFINKALYDLERLGWKDAMRRVPLG